MAIKALNDVTMSFDDWVLVPNNPVQRPTEDHLGHALKKHLNPQTFNSVLAERVSRVMWRGTWFKNDGHTRTMGMLRGFIPKLKSFKVTSYSVDSIDELEALYYSTDNLSSAKTTKDAFSGILNKLYSAKSAYLVKGNFKTGLAITTGLKDLDNVAVASSTIAKWLPVLKKVDELGLPMSSRKRGWNHGVLAAAFLSMNHWGSTVNRNGRSVQEFWTRLVLNQGVKASGKMDGVQAAWEIIASESKGKQKDTDSICGRILSCVVSHMDENYYQLPPRPSNKDTFRQRRADWT